MAEHTEEERQFIRRVIALFRSHLRQVLLRLVCLLESDQTTIQEEFVQNTVLVQGGRCDGRSNSENEPATSTSASASRPSRPTPVPLDGPSGRWYERCTRFYVVWGVPDRPELVGIWCGSDVATWNYLVSFLPTQTYVGSGARLKRFDNWQSALTAFRYGGPQNTHTSAHPKLFRSPC